MSTVHRGPRVGVLLLLGGVTSCAALAGLDGDYVVGQAGGAGATGTGTGGMVTSSSAGMGGQGTPGGASATGGSGGSAGVGASGGAGGGPACTPIGLLDAFGGTSVNPSNWNQQGQTNMLVVSNGTLKLDGGQPGVFAGWSGLVTPQHFNFPDKCVWIEVLNLHHGGIDGGTYWQLYSSAGTASFTVSNGMLELHISTAGNPVETALSYSPTEHRWWRIRETGGTLYMETAPLGTVWTERLSAASPSYLSDVVVGLGVTGADVQPIVGYTELDNLNAPAP
jgi:hypothetical protein